MKCSVLIPFTAEPPPGYAHRPPMVVDGTALGAVLFDEPARDAALARLIGRTLHAPYLLDHEIVTVALHKRAKDWHPLNHWRSPWPITRRTRLSCIRST